MDALAPHESLSLGLFFFLLPQSPKTAKGVSGAQQPLQPSPALCSPAEGLGEGCSPPAARMLGLGAWPFLVHGPLKTRGAACVRHCVLAASKGCKALSASCCHSPRQERGRGLICFSPPGSCLKLQVGRVDGSTGESLTEEVAGYPSFRLVQDRAGPGTQ